MFLDVPVDELANKETKIIVITVVTIVVVAVLAIAVGFLIKSKKN